MRPIRGGMSRMQNVSQIPDMMSSIHHLDIDIIAVPSGRFVEYYREKAIGVGKLKALRMYLNALASYDGYCRGTILDEVIPSFTNVKSIVIRGYYGSWCGDSTWGHGLYTPVAKLANWWYMNIRKVDFDDESFPDLRLKGLLDTISNLPSSVSLESLTIYEFPLLAFHEWDEKEQTMIDSTHCMYESFSNLRHLMLNIKPGLHLGLLRIKLRDRRPFDRGLGHGDEGGVGRGAVNYERGSSSPLVSHSLAALILSMQKLHHLNLRWHHQMRWLPNNEELQGEWGKCFFTGTFPLLTKLSLYSFKTTEDQLVDFLTRHRDTLTHLSLDAEIIKVVGTKNGSYRRLLTRIRDNLHLQKFEFTLKSNLSHDEFIDGLLYDEEWTPAYLNIYHVYSDAKIQRYQSWPPYRWARLLEEYVVGELKWPMLNDNPSIPSEGTSLFWEPLLEFEVKEPSPAES
jgi:hypothetical protein